MNSALIRARERMERFRERHGAEPKIAALTPAQKQLLRSYVEAWEAGDVDARPFPAGFSGVFSGDRAFRLFPTVANGRPAFAFYKSGDPCLPGESAHAAFAPHCIQVVWLAGRRVGRIVSFLSPRLVKEFGFGVSAKGLELSQAQRALPLE